MSVGNRIKAARKKRGLTQKQLGELCGMADSAIRRYESDRGNPTVKTLRRIAKALNVTIGYLQGYDSFEAGELLSAVRNRDVRKVESIIGLSEGSIIAFENADEQNGESHDKYFSAEMLQKIATFLGCDIRDLVPSARQTTPESLRKIEELMGKEPGYLESDLPTELSETAKRIHRVKTAFDGMSQEGQEEATRRVEELARLPEYQKKSNTSLERAWNFGGGNDNAIDTQKDE